MVAMVPPTRRNIRPSQMNCLAMTLWSVEKTYFRRKLVVSGCMCCSSCLSSCALLSIVFRLPEVPSPVRLGVGLVETTLRGHLLRLQPLVVLLGTLDGEPAAHLVVADSAVLCT